MKHLAADVIDSYLDRQRTAPRVLNYALGVMFKVCTKRQRTGDDYADFCKLRGIAERAAKACGKTERVQDLIERELQWDA